MSPSRLGGLRDRLARRLLDPILDVDIDPSHHVTKGKFRYRNSTGEQEKGTALLQAFQLNELAQTLELPAPLDKHADGRIEESSRSDHKKAAR